jgi:hypothetical protein
MEDRKWKSGDLPQVPASADTWHLYNHSASSSAEPIFHFPLPSFRLSCNLGVLRSV